MDRRHGVGDLVLDSPLNLALEELSHHEQGQEQEEASPQVDEQALPIVVISLRGDNK